nr:AraC family transcriptional regulator [Acinetobacter sp. Marseille-Q1620]
MPIELQIANGYFQLWNAYLKQQNIEWINLDLTSEQNIALSNILSEPMDKLSPYSFFMELIELTRNKIDCPDLAFAMAKCISPANFGLLGYMASRSENLAQALEYVVRFSRLVIDGDHITPMKYQRDGKIIRMYCSLGHEKFIFLHEVTLAAMLHLARAFVSAEQTFPLFRMSFVNKPLVALKYYQDFYQCELYFEQPEYEVVFSNDVLDLKPEQADPNLIQLLVKQAEDTMQQRSQQSILPEQLHFIIAEYLRLRQQAPKIEDIAQELNMSSRTLQRQLSQFDTSFKRILEIERMQRCESLLKQGMGLTDIALELGYSDQSALARAYKAASGQTLLQKKQTLIANEIK